MNTTTIDPRNWAASDERDAENARDLEAARWLIELADDIASHDAYVRWMRRDGRGSSVSGAMRDHELARAGSIVDPEAEYAAFVTDATTSAFAATATGGGSSKVPVYSDGTVWRIG